MIAAAPTTYLMTFVTFPPRFGWKSAVPGWYLG